MPPTEAATDNQKPKGRGRAAPEFWQVANGLYHDSFGVRDSNALSEAMEDFAELNEGDRQFYLAQLLYLNVEGMAVMCRKLDAIIERLDVGLDVLEDAFPGAPEEDSVPLVTEPDELPREREAHTAPAVPEPDPIAPPSSEVVVPDEVIIPAKPPKGGKAGK